MSRQWLRLASAPAIAIAFSSSSCGGGRTSGALGSPDGGPASDATSTTTVCATDADCAATVPVTTPANCATGKCNAVQGVCEYVAKDRDGDGHPSANCVSTTTVAVQAGDDCNDNDPNLYPGHPEMCTTLPDGGAAGDGYCAPGTITCDPDGTESACSNTTVCVNQTCLNSHCVGSCAQGQTACVGNASEACTAAGTFGGAVPCTRQACVGGVTAAGTDGSAPASCQGMCAPGGVSCDGAQPQSCSADGQWQNLGAPCSGAAPVCSDGACGTCTPGAPSCNGLQPQQCNSMASGMQNVGPPCSGSTPACLGGACVACVPASLNCSGVQPQKCDPTGTWQNAGSPCSGSTPVCLNGACAVCIPGSVSCLSIGNPAQCMGNGDGWVGGLPCSGSKPLCLNGTCVSDD
jgi:hypothetical protein